jgi:predicted nucleotidyltransferase component of viral defense system
MSTEDEPYTVDIGAWVERARSDPQRYRERQATEVLLAAVGQSGPYGEKLYLKGGVLMGVVYRSPRQTADIDFTAEFPPSDDIEEQLRAALDPELRRASARLGYPDLVCRVQRVERRPRRDRFTDADFPALNMTIAHAERGTNAHEQLKQGLCPSVLKMEISFREPVHAVRLVHFGSGAPAGVRTYSLEDIIAEKLRALLQQDTRHRYRRQDIYDIDFLIRELPPGPAEKRDILDALLTKARARHIEPGPESLADPEVRRRAEADWHTLELELGDLPAFGDTFDRVEAFYRDLPWGEALSTDP